MNKTFDFEAIMKRQREEFEAARPQRVAFFREKILPTYIDQWSPALHALSVDTIYHPFPVALYHDAQNGKHEAFTDTMVKSINVMREVIPGAFFRLGSRSPKDWWYGHPSLGEDRGCTQPRDASAEDIAFSFVLSERTSKDVFDAEDAGYNPQLCARAWVKGIEPFREFRCFMKGRELAGISVYRAWEEEPKPEIVADPKRWEKAIREWFPRFREVSPLDDVVFDTVVLDDRVVLLEINPYIGSTYPGHFLGKEFDGRFRYIGDGDSEPVD